MAHTSLSDGLACSPEFWLFWISLTHVHLLPVWCHLLSGLSSEFRQLQFIIKQFGFRVTIELLLKFFLCGVICWWGFCQEFNSPSSHARFSRSLLFLNLAIGSE